MLTLAAVALVGCSSGGQPAATATGVVTGTVLSAPTCPVERSDSTCPPVPVSGATVAARTGDRDVARTTTRIDGTFRLSVPAGSYDIVATNIGGYASTAQAHVTVGSGQTSEVTLTVDSGIR